MRTVEIILPAIDIGGGQRFCLNFTKYLNSIHYDYEVIFLRKRKSEELYQEFKRNKINFVEFGEKTASAALPKLIKRLKCRQPDVVLSTVGNVDFIATIAKIFVPKTKLIIRKANVVFDDQKSIINKIKLKLESLLCCKMIALTNDMKQDYLQYGFRDEQIVVINNMIDIEYILSRAEEQEENHKWFIDKEGRILIANARMVPEKRYDVLIQAFCLLANDCDNVKLLILGDGKQKKEIEKLIPENLKSKVEFLGFKNNPFFYISRADVFVLSSDYEGFPNVVIEALACGLPVVSTDCKTGPREIIDNGVDGWVVERGNPAAMAEGIKKVIDDDKMYAIYSKNAKKKSQRYRVENIAKQYIGVFESIGV